MNTICIHCGKEYTDLGALDICYNCFNSLLIKEDKMDERKLINVKLNDGTIVPIGNPDDLEMVINEKGEAVIKIKENK